jgi:hypothetical protein
VKLQGKNIVSPEFLDDDSGQLNVHVSKKRKRIKEWL